MPADPSVAYVGNGRSVVAGLVRLMGTFMCSDKWVFRSLEGCGYRNIGKSAKRSKRLKSEAPDDFSPGASFDHIVTHGSVGMR